MRSCPPKSAERLLLLLYFAPGHPLAFRVWGGRWRFSECQGVLAETRHRRPFEGRRCPRANVRAIRRRVTRDRFVPIPRHASERHEALAGPARSRSPARKKKAARSARPFRTTTEAATLTSSVHPAAAPRCASPRVRCRESGEASTSACEGKSKLAVEKESIRPSRPDRFRSAPTWNPAGGSPQGLRAPRGARSHAEVFARSGRA